MTSASIADGDTQAFLDRRLGETPGNIVDGATGAVLGHHAGAHGYTIGQRKGLRLDRPAADGRPRYVLSITPVTNTVTVGPVEALDVTVITAERPVWTGMCPPDGSVRAEVQMRAHGDMTSAQVAVAPDGTLVTTLDSPVRGIAPAKPSWPIGTTRTAMSCSGRPRSPGRITRPRSRRDRAICVVARVCDRHRLAARDGHRGGGQDRARRVAGSAVPPELPARGPGADMVGRSAGLLVEMPVELYASRWRIASHAGRDLGRTRDLWERDLDALTDAAAGLDGPIKLQVAGPWTLAASVDLPIGGRLLRDPGAVRDLTASLAEGLAVHVADVGPGCRTPA